MRAVVSIIMLGALGITGAEVAGYTASEAASPVAYQTKTDQVTVLNVEGMT